MAKFTDEDDALLEELGIEVETKANSKHSPREERIIAGFEDIQRFFEAHGHAPQHGEGRDIFERLYAVRLDRLRTLDDCRALLAPLDHQGLLAGAPARTEISVDDMDDDALLAELGVPPEAAAGARGEALQWALLRGSRSGRVAWQFARDYAGHYTE